MCLNLLELLDQLIVSDVQVGGKGVKVSGIFMRGIKEGLELNIQGIVY